MLKNPSDHSTQPKRIAWSCRQPRLWSRPSSSTWPCPKGSLWGWLGRAEPESHSSRTATSGDCPRRSSWRMSSTSRRGPASITRRRWSCPSLTGAGREFSVRRWARSASSSLTTSTCLSRTPVDQSLPWSFSDRLNVFLFNAKACILMLNWYYVTRSMNLKLTVVNICSIFFARGQVVRGCEFVSQHRILDGLFFTFICSKFLWCLKRHKQTIKRPRIAHKNCLH